MRLDLLLLRLRFARSRAIAQDWICAGHMRCNGRRVTKPSHKAAAGDILTLPMASHVRVIEILALPARRGPAREAQQHYRVLDDGGQFAIAGEKRATRPGIEGPPAQ